MIRLLAIITSMIFGLAANAQSLPDRYMVSGVAADDTLNIRRDPDASSDIIGELGPFTLNVEALDKRDGWAQIPTPEGWGWVSMRFLSENPWPAGEIPRPLQCSGTEPFWSFTLWPRGIEYNALADERGNRPQSLLSETVASNGFRVHVQDGDDEFRTLTVDGRICSDGMSDRPFAMSATLFHETPDGNYIETGCCTMQVN